MVYISAQDFCEKARKYHRLSRQEELNCAREMKNGDLQARRRLIQSYLPFVAGYIGRLPEHIQGVGLVTYCLQALERAVDSFNFFQEGESFIHRLSWCLRQASTGYIARRGCEDSDTQ